MHHIFSTLTSDQLYTKYEQSGNDLPRVVAQVLIKGGTGVANDRLVTPRGVATSVDDSQMAVLMDVEAFTNHVKAGFLTVSDSKEDPEKVAADMQGRDGSAPLVPQDLPEGQQPAVGAQKRK